MAQKNVIARSNDFLLKTLILNNLIDKNYENSKIFKLKIRSNEKHLIIIVPFEYKEITYYIQCKLNINAEQNTELNKEIKRQIKTTKSRLTKKSYAMELFINQIKMKSLYEDYLLPVDNGFDMYQYFTKKRSQTNSRMGVLRSLMNQKEILNYIKIDNKKLL